MSSSQWARTRSPFNLPRAPGDLDIWVRRSPENAPRVIEALRRFGAPLHDLTGEDLTRPDVVFQIGVVPCRVDILTGISGVEFEAAWPGRMPVTVEGLSVACIGRADLMANKRAAGRPQDIADVARLEARQG